MKVVLPKIRITLLLTLSMMIFRSYTYGQTENKIEIVGDTIENRDAFFIGEVHSNKEAAAFTYSMVTFVNEQYGINNIVLEYGKSFAWLCNQYLLSGDTTVFSYVSKSFRKTLANYKAKKQSLPIDKQLTIYGIDFERMQFLKVLKMNFDKHPAAASTELYKYVFSFPDSITRLNVLEPDQAKLRKAIYGKARQLFYEDQLNLKALLEADYEIVASILTNPATEKHFGDRNRTMCLNLIEQLKGKRFICITGLDHMDNSQYLSTLRRYARRTKKKYTVMQEVCKFNSSNDLIAPKCLTKNDSALSVVYSQYRKPGIFAVVNHDHLKPMVRGKSFGRDTYYAFFEQETMNN